MTVNDIAIDQIFTTRITEQTYRKITLGTSTPMDPSLATHIMLTLDMNNVSLAYSLKGGYAVLIANDTEVQDE